MEKHLLKLLLNKEFYDEHKHHVIRSFFPDEVAALYDTVKEAHERYGRSITLTELRELHKVLNPTLTVAQRNAIFGVLLDLQEEGEKIAPDIGGDVIRHMWKVETGRRIADAGLEIMEGKADSLIEIERIIEQTQDDFIPDEDPEYTTTDVHELLEKLEARSCWQFNIEGLREKVPGGAGGDFMILFARPEVGKTAAWVSLACGPGGFASQGAKVHAFVNEEPAVRTMMRAITSAAGYAKEDIKEDPRKAAPWGLIRNNVFMVDSVDMSMEALDGYCRRHKPDVLIVDQLDKVHVTGSFARTDEKLREIYMQAREIAKRHNCFVIGISQASADAEGKTRVTYAMMENSRTGKAAEADIIIGVGKQAMEDAGSEEDNSVRYLTCSKNKITGWHGTVPCKLEGAISRYID